MAAIEDINSIKDERAKIRKFITAYHSLPVLWDVKCLDYTKKDKRNKAYDMLLSVFRTVKYDATVEDVKKKINSMRSNFRKELKKVTESANAGVDYRPSSWMYEELMFLKELETSSPWTKSSSYGASDENDFKNHADVNIVDGDFQGVYPQYSMKRPRYVEMKQNDEQNQVLVCNSAYSSCENEGDIAKVWASKLKYLDHMQRLYAEKAINDILFEAQLGTLQRNSVKINDFSIPIRSTMNPSIRRTYHQPLEPSQSSPEYKYSETEVFHPDGSFS